MDTESWSTSEPVTALPDEVETLVKQGVYGRLLRRGYRFGFFQTVRLLEQLFAEAPAPGTSADYRAERIRFRPSTALIFPATDLKRVEWKDEQARAHVVTTFMGLYGIDSPLPYYFYDDLATEAEDTFAHRDFLDVFNHRFYAYFYRAWKKYRPGLHHRPGGRDAQSKRFLSLAGLGTPQALEASSRPPMELAALAGRLGPRTRNAAGLQAVLDVLFEGIPIAVIENVPRWVPIRSRPALGQQRPARLGQRATIGERVYDRSSKFRIRIGPVGVDEYLAFLPGGDQAERLRRVVRTYAPDFLDFDVALQVRTEEMPQTCLGDRSARLGLTTCLGRPRDAAIERVVDYAA